MPVLANLNPWVLIYYSSISLSSHAKLCPIAECDVMSSCNDEDLQNKPASGDKPQLKRRKDLCMCVWIHFHTMHSVAELWNVRFEYKELTHVNVSLSMVSFHFHTFTFFCKLGLFQRAHLLDNTERLERSSRRLDAGYQIAVETGKHCG